MQGKTMKRAISVILSISVVLLSVFTGASVIAEEGTYVANRITIHPGIDDTYLNFAWQSEELAETASVRIKAEGTDNWTVFTGESKAFVISEDGYEEGYHDTFVKNCGHTCADVCGHEACTASQCYHGTYTDPYYNQVTVSGLEYGVSYTYQLGDGTNWTADYTTQIADSDPDEGFSYLVFGDSQTADQYYGDYMKKALELSVDKFDDIDFLMNLGDNVHENNNRNYNAYFTAQDILAQYPIAVVIGNHELNLCTNGDRINFSDHPTLALQNPPAADERQDYWFRYGDVLFITFNSGPQQTSMMADLEQLIIDAKAAHPDTRWTILQTHQGFYSNNGGGKVWRKDFTSIISKYDIDLVFNGHHHMYSRTESLVFDSTLTCEHAKSSPEFSCAACSGSIEVLGENDVQVEDTFVGAVKTTEPNYEELEGVTYDKTVERYDPEGVTFIHLDSLTAEGHDQYATIAGETLAATNAYSVNTVAGQGAITKVTVGKDADGNDQLKVETFWINNNGTPRITNSADISLLDDDYIEDTPYDTYTIHKTTEVKDIEVTFDGGTDRGIFTRKINSGETVAEPANPIMTGKSFKYWTLDGETEFDFATTLTADTTLTAVYEDIPPTTTADLFIEAVNRGDSEIILAGDITLTEVVTLNTNTTIKSVEGQKYTLTLDGAARLVVAKGKTVTFDGIGITIASTANTISDAYNNGTYITVGSGGNRAALNIYNCTVTNLMTDMGAANTGIIASSKNASSVARIENSVITSAVTNTSTGGSILGQYITVYATDTSMTNANSGAWFCTSSTEIVLYGTSSYVGWKHNSATLYDFRNTTVKIARNADNLIELTKIGSGTAVTSDSYKIYYAFEDIAFAEGTAIEYTEPIADVDYETPVYATVYYTGTSYYGDVTSKICGEYIEGVEVSAADGFVNAIANGDSVTLTADITLADLGEIVIGADSKILSKNGSQYTITLDGSTRLTVASGKTVTLQDVNITLAETIDTISSGYYYGYITVNSSANLYVNGCTIKSDATTLGASDVALIKIARVSSNPGYVQIEDSAMVSPSAQNVGVALNGINHESAKPVFRIIDSSITGNWIFYQCRYILEGTTTYSGYNSGTIYDFRNTTVKAARTADDLIELSKIGTGTAATDDTFKIYYSLDETAFANGTATEYTEPIADIGYETPIYVALRYSDTIYYSTVEPRTCGEYVEGIAVDTADAFVNAIKNGESVITLTADITLNDLGEIVTIADTVIQSKSGATYSITLDGLTRLATASGSTATLRGINVIVPASATVIEDGWTTGGYLEPGSGAVLYIEDCTVNCLAADIGTSAASIIRPAGNNSCTVYIINSTVSSQTNNEQGALIGGTNATYRVIDSTLKPQTGSTWLCTSTNIIAEGTTTYTGWKANGTKVSDFTNTSVAAQMAVDTVSLTKVGTGTAATSETHKIYYSTDASAFENGTATEYTEALTLDAGTAVYVAMKDETYGYYSTPVKYIIAKSGDVNNDGVVNDDDVTMLRKCLIGAASCDTIAADVSGDAVVDILDLVLLHKR